MINYAASLPLLPIILAAAPFVGSFLGTLALRLPEGRNPFLGRSHCESCGHPLGVGDLFPLLSWIALQGKCRHCGAPIGYIYLVSELGSLLVVICAATEVSGALLIATVLFGWLLLALSIADWRSGRLPDLLTLAVAVLGAASTLEFDSEYWLEHLAAALIGGGALILVGLAYRRLRHRDGLGLGDAKLFAAIGMWVSLAGLPSVLLASAILAMTVFLTRHLLKKVDPLDRMPFGPFLALAAWLVWLYGPLVPVALS